MNGVERDVRDDAPDVLHVRELDQEQRQERMMEMIQVLPVYNRNIHSKGGTFTIWERV
jgi:hypothetical protein